MSDFIHFRNNKDRYNIYQSYLEPIEPKSYYEPLRNTLLFVAITLSLFISILISFDMDQKKKSENSKIILINGKQHNLVKDEITQFELTQVISNSVIQKVETDESLKEINNMQLKRIIEKVMEKIENSPNQIIYN